MSQVRENQQLGVFRLLRRIGSGGMGEVWLAEDTRLLRTVALKILPQLIADDVEARGRLLREARLAAQLNHPSIAMVHAVEEHAGRLFVAMEFVEGLPLAAALAERRLSDYDVVRIARDIADALSAAHARGIVHRDIKPDNVMIAGQRVKVLDFGVAKQVGAEQRHQEFQTDIGTVVGTPEYMSPEQALGRSIDARTDIFSLGVLLYHSLAGTLPFAGATVTEILLKICRDEPAPFYSVRPDLPEELGKIIAKCMQKDRELRYDAAHDLAAALEGVMPRLSRAKALPVTPTVMLSATEAAAAVAAALDIAPKLAVAEPKPSPAPIAGKRMLIADDDPAIVRLFATLAKRQGIDCDTAANGPEAIAALKRGEYALMFLDLMMPRIDGWGVLDYLRSRGRRVPALFIVTAFLDQTVSAADAEVVTAIIYKPVDANEIGALIAQCARGDAPSALHNTRHRMIASGG